MLFQPGVPLNNDGYNDQSQFNKDQPIELAVPESEYQRLKRIEELYLNANNNSQTVPPVQTEQVQQQVNVSEPIFNPTEWDKMVDSILNTGTYQQQEQVKQVEQKLIPAQEQNDFDVVMGQLASKNGYRIEQLQDIARTVSPEDIFDFLQSRMQRNQMPVERPQPIIQRFSPPNTLSQENSVNGVNMTRSNNVNKGFTF